MSQAVQDWGGGALLNPPLIKALYIADTVFISFTNLTMGRKELKSSSYSVIQYLQYVYVHGKTAVD